MISCSNYLLVIGPQAVEVACNYRLLTKNIKTNKKTNSSSLILRYKRSTPTL